MQTPARLLLILARWAWRAVIDRRLVDILAQGGAVAGSLFIARLTQTLVPTELQALWSVAAVFAATALMKLVMPRHTILRRIRWLGVVCMFAVFGLAAFLFGRPWIFGLWSPLAWLAVLVAYGCAHFAFLNRLGDDAERRAD
ncbi:MAG: hypothetical protein HY054_12575 [Proteobacteria bacterium]|nr:hypothetical protein [Pseudomonadota bacterium]